MLFYFHCYCCRVYRNTNEMLIVNNIHRLLLSRVCLRHFDTSDSQIRSCVQRSTIYESYIVNIAYTRIQLLYDRNKISQPFNLNIMKKFNNDKLNFIFFFHSAATLLKNEYIDNWNKVLLFFLKFFNLFLFNFKN